MALKNARLARIENLPPDIKATLEKKEGLIIIESLNPDLQENFVPISDEGGITEYLLTLGDFKNIEIPDEE